MRLAFVIHRYGDSVAGGSEAHARGLAQELRLHHEVEVLTTTASDGRKSGSQLAEPGTWRGSLLPGANHCGTIPP